MATGTSNRECSDWRVVPFHTCMRGQGGEEVSAGSWGAPAGLGFAKSIDWLGAARLKVPLSKLLKHYMQINVRRGLAKGLVAALQTH